MKTQAGWQATITIEDEPATVAQARKLLRMLGWSGAVETTDDGEFLIPLPVALDPDSFGGLSMTVHIDGEAWQLDVEMP